MHTKTQELHNYGARIDQLKKEGYEFKTEWESKTNRYGEKTDYKRYFLVDMTAENMDHVTRIDQEVVMNKQKALEITRDRIENLNKFIPSNESEKEVTEETLEFLKFVEGMLEDQPMDCTESIEKGLCLGCRTSRAKHKRR